MSENDMIIIMFIVMVFYVPYSSLQIAGIRDELNQVIRRLKEQRNE